MNVMFVYKYMYLMQSGATFFCVCKFVLNPVAVCQLTFTQLYIAHSRVMYVHICIVIEVIKYVYFVFEL